MINFATNMQPTPTSFNNGFSWYETLSQLIYQINQLIDGVNTSDVDIATLKDYKSKIETYLSETGNFTGTWNGVEMSLTNEGLSSDWNGAKGTFASVSDRLNYLTDFKNHISGSVYNMKELGLYSDDTHETENSALINAFIEEHKTEAITMYFPVGIYKYNLPIIRYPKHNVKGDGVVGTKLHYVGTGNGMQLPVSTDSSYEFTYLDTFHEDFTLQGVGSSYGSNATSNGIYLGDENQSKLFNTPMLRFNRVRVMGFDKAIYLEGYGHTLNDVYCSNNNQGLILIHPEQVLCNNVWLEYANIGLHVNPLSKVSRNYGHNMQFIGGSVQRNVIGSQILNFMDLEYKTYSELNTGSDLILGNTQAVGDYTNSVTNAKVVLNTNGSYTDNCIKMIASKYSDVQVLNYSSTTNTSPLIKLDGYSKNNVIRLSSENIKANTPVDILGDAIKTTTIITDGTPNYYRYGGGTVDKVSVTTSDNVIERLVEYISSSNHLVNKMSSDSSFGVKLTGGNNSCFDVLDNSGAKMFTVSLVNNAILKKHLIIPDNKGIVLYSPNGTKYLVTVNDSGVVTSTATSISY